MKKTSNKQTTYEYVSNNIYFDGSSFRTRMSINGKKYSKSFPSERKAKQYRKELLSNVTA